MRTLAFLAALAVAAPGLLPAQIPDSSLLRRAQRLHREVPMADGHNDFPWEVRNQLRGSFDTVDMARGLPTFQTDIPRLRAGGVGAQFWSLWTPDSMVRYGPARFTLEQLDIVQRMEARWSTAFAPARTADDILRAHRQGRIASLMGIEGGDAIENSLPLLRVYYGLGVRYMTLTWNRGLAWADAAADTARHNGLSPFGREVVREMNRLGMLVDISHVSDSVMAQVLRLSEAPAIFSHSSARALAEHRRNVPDWVLRMVPANGGLVLVNFYCPFIDRANRPDIARVADHIEHIRTVAGVDHVGYGSDFDGIDCAPVGLEDVSTFPRLTAELLRRGWSDADVKKVIGENLLRVMRGAEAAARRLQAQRGPSVATIGQLDSAGVRP